MNTKSIATRKLQRQFVAIAAVFLLLSVSIGCKKKPNPGAANAQANSQIGQIAAGDQNAAIHIPNGDNVTLDGSKSYAHITYLPSVKMFEDSEVRSSLMGITSDGHGFLFQNASREHQGPQGRRCLHGERRDGRQSPGRGE